MTSSPFFALLPRPRCVFSDLFGNNQQGQQDDEGGAGGGGGRGGGGYNSLAISAQIDLIFIAANKNKQRRANGGQFSLHSMGSAPGGDMGEWAGKGTRHNDMEMNTHLDLVR